MCVETHPATDNLPRCGCQQTPDHSQTASPLEELWRDTPKEVGHHDTLCVPFCPSEELEFTMLVSFSFRLPSLLPLVGRFPPVFIF